eukprot:392923-Amphidinium_carterae.1
METMFLELARLCDVAVGHSGKHLEGFLCCAERCVAKGWDWHSGPTSGACRASGRASGCYLGCGTHLR